MMNKIFFTVISVFIMTWVQPTYAYIDPGSGSAIMSAIIGFFVAIGLVLKTYWYKLKSMIFGENQDSQSDIKKENEDL